MKNLKTTLSLTKCSLIELQQEQLLTINGGSGILGVDTDTNPCSGCACLDIDKKIRTIFNPVGGNNGIQM